MGPVRLFRDLLTLMLFGSPVFLLAVGAGLVGTWSAGYSLGNARTYTRNSKAPSPLSAGVVLEEMHSDLWCMSYSYSIVSSGNINKDNDFWICNWGFTVICTELTLRHFYNVFFQYIPFGRLVYSYLTAIQLFGSGTIFLLFELSIHFK